MPSLETFACVDDRKANRQAIRAGSRSFYTASFLLPRSVRQDAFDLYAFCRAADDMIDAGGGSAALAGLRARLDGIYSGRPCDHSADRALAVLVRRRHIPRELLEALLEGLAWDCEGRRYASLEALQDYAARVAGSVGAMMTLLMGVRDPQALARACDLGAAMQLTNIARDVGEDARAGRLYLPLDWLHQAAIDPEAFLANPRPSPALAAVIARLLATAEELYTRSLGGIAHLPVLCRPAILTAAALYAEIGREVARRECDSVTSRARVPTSRKLALLAQASLDAFTTRRGMFEPPLEAAAFLVEAVTKRRPIAEPRYSLRSHFVRVLEIFERLERAERVGL